MKSTSKSSQIIKIITLGALLISQTLTSSGSANSDKTIVETAQQAGVFNTLLAAAQAAGLAEWIDNATPKTVFAPTDDAFAKLPAGTVDSLLLPENKATLTRILQYHIVLGEVMSTEITTGIVTTTLSAGLKVDTSNGVTLNGSTKVITADVEAKNGIIHIIDSVLLPPENNVVDLAATDPDLTTLAAALTAAGLLDAVRTSGPITILAPTNSAFAALPEGTLDTLLAEENLTTLKNILLYHVIPGNVYSGGLQNGPIATLNGGSIIVNLAGPVFGFQGGGSNPVQVDILGRNGVIHKVDTVLLPGSDTIVDVASANGNFSTLLTAATAAGLVETLTNIKGATLFAPTDAAFGKLPIDTLQMLLLPENKELLANVLLYHVIPQNVYSSNIATHAYPTAAGPEVRVEVSNAGVKVGTASMVTATDIIASNGVVHVVDSVILPPLNMADTLASWPQYSTLVAALKAAGLYETLNSAGPFTLFAPTNAAFEKLPAGTVESLLQPANLETLQSILLAHVIGDKVLGGALLQGELITLQGKKLNLHFVHGALNIGTEATVTGTDMPVWNGVIHSIDSVLIP